MESTLSDSSGGNGEEKIDIIFIIIDMSDIFDMSEKFLKIKNALNCFAITSNRSLKLKTTFPGDIAFI